MLCRRVGYAPEYRDPQRCLEKTLPRSGDRLGSFLPGLHAKVECGKIEGTPAGGGLGFPESGISQPQVIRR